MPYSLALKHHSLLSSTEQLVASLQYREVSFQKSAAFYTTAGAVAGSGVASMQFGSTNNGIGRRNLRGDEGGRMLQEDDAAAAAEFELDFDVTQATPYGTSSAASVGAMASAVASMLIAAMM